MLREGVHAAEGKLGQLHSEMASNGLQVAEGG